MLVSYVSSLEKLYEKRIHSEVAPHGRSGFQRDRDRIIYSESFRKLEHKTQVFMSSESDYYRTRLTHSLEVAQIARSICKRFLLSDDLAEAIALASNLGYPPFGHVAESELNLLAMTESNNTLGFHSTLQSLRVVTELEQKYISFDGLNLTFGTIEGVIKKNGPLVDDSDYVTEQLISYCQKYEIHPEHFPPLEAQIASVATKIASTMHDLDDGLQSGALSTDDIKHVPIVGDAFIEFSKKYPSSNVKRLVHETLRRSMNQIIEELCTQIEHNIRHMNIRSPIDVARANQPVVRFSARLNACSQEVDQLLKEKVYEYFKVSRTANKAKSIVQEVFNYLHKNPNCLPKEWLEKFEESDNQLTILLDYISGLTDKTIMNEWRDCICLDQINCND